MSLQLPMLAFRINGTGGYIKLIIDEVWGFPNRTCYGGGYDAKGNLKIVSAEYSVSATHYFATGELYKFYVELRKCYESLKGVATLENIERELELKCEFNKLGHVIISGSFQSDSSVKNVLTFEIKTDQTQVKDTLSNLNTVYETFGDERGKRE